MSFKILVPDLNIDRRCPWVFPETITGAIEAIPTSSNYVGNYEYPQKTESQED